MAGIAGAESSVAGKPPSKVAGNSPEGCPKDGGRVFSTVVFQSGIPVAGRVSNVSGSWSVSASGGSDGVAAEGVCASEAEGFSDGAVSVAHAGRLPPSIWLNFPTSPGSGFKLGSSFVKAARALFPDSLWCANFEVASGFAFSAGLDT